MKRPKGIWDERTKTFIKPSGTVKQGRRPMFKPYDEPDYSTEPLKPGTPFPQNREPEEEYDEFKDYRYLNDDYWSLRDDGRNDDGTGESYAERNT